MLPDDYFVAVRASETRRPKFEDDVQGPCTGCGVALVWRASMVTEPVAKICAKCLVVAQKVQDRAEADMEF